MKATTGLPDEYYRRIRAARYGSLRIVVICGAIAGFTGYEAVCEPRGSLLTASVASSLFLLMMSVSWSSIDPRAARMNSRFARIVPYFEARVDGPDTFFKSGHSIAVNCAHLDALALQLNVRTISSFGFHDSYENRHILWHEPAEGLRTVRTLTEHLLGHASAVVDRDATVKELKAIAARLEAACDAQIRFCLHLRIDSAYTGVEFDNREGRY